ncbi:HpcH/HpaI aldolase/citrate lyase family protein [Streptomyces brasiliensis]|nr:CoA ester lyase [Streptomyces brasiliensis]
MTFLFVPGDRPERFAKAATAGADLGVLDLEDAVADKDKAAARTSIANWLESGGRGVVRVNGRESSHHDDDVAALVGLPGLAGVMLAKAESPEAADAVSLRTGVPVIALIETARGVAGAEDIATSRSVARLAFGHLDYAQDLGAEPTQPAMLHARAILVQASRLAGLPGPVDGVTTHLDNTDVLAADVRHAKELGMSGKLLIHPKQIAPTQAGFKPDARSVAWARKVVAAGRSGQAVRVDGQMVDAPVVARAEAILARFEQPGADQ